MLRFKIEGLPEVLEPTILHPLYSEDRGEWVHAGELKVGERLRTKTGPARIEAISQKEGTYRVYNFEVEETHAYYTSASKVLSHNAVGDNCAGTNSQPAATGTDPVKRRVNLRKDVVSEIKARQPRNTAGEMVDPYTREPLTPSETDISHKPGQEWWRRKQMHRTRGSTRQEVLDMENDPDLYQLEDRSSNRSHCHEQR